VGLETHTAQKYRYPIRVCILHLALKNTVELLKAAVVDYHFVAGLEFCLRFYKTFWPDPGSDQADDLLINRGRLVVETH
jgi:hypothetical protein